MHIEKLSVNSDILTDTGFMALNAELIAGAKNDAGETGFSVFSIPPKTVLNDCVNKLEAGFERWIFGTRELRIYVFPVEIIEKLPQVKKFNKNSVEDILLYRQTSLRQPSRKRFLEIAEKRFEKGMSVYTYAENGVLQSYMWVDPSPKAYYGSGVDQEIAAVEDSIYVQDAYTNPFTRSKGLAQAGFCQLANDIIKMEGKKCLYLAVFGTNNISRYGVEKLGGILTTSYFCQTRFGFRKTWTVEHSRYN